VGGAILLLNEPAIGSTGPVDKGVEDAAATCGFSLQLPLDSHGVLANGGQKDRKERAFCGIKSRVRAETADYKRAGGARQP
jgi:hypothetical protein